VSEQGGVTMRRRLSLSVPLVALRALSVRSATEARDMKAIVLRVASPGGGSRGLSADRVQQIVRGRVWPGADAKERGLVDELGGLGTAMEVARERAGLSPSAQPELRTYPRVPLVAPAAHRPSRARTRSPPAPRSDPRPGGRSPTWRCASACRRTGRSRCRGTGSWRDWSYSRAVVLGGKNSGVIVGVAAAAVLPVAPHRSLGTG
jgi:Peptidase family S49